MCYLQHSTHFTAKKVVQCIQIRVFAIDRTAELNQAELGGPQLTSL